MAGLPDVERERLDAEANFTVDCVCHKCNTGWMRKLENKCLPFLQRMLVGVPTTLTERQTFLLRRWAIKTALAFECYQGNVHTSGRLRRSLMEGESPWGAAVILGSYEGRHLLLHSRARFSVPRTLDTVPLNVNVDQMWVTLVLGKVLFHVFTDFDVQGIRQATLTPEAKENLIQLPPGEGIKIEWPPASPVDDPLLSVLVHGPRRNMRPPSSPPPL